MWSASLSASTALLALGVTTVLAIPASLERRGITPRAVSASSWTNLGCISDSPRALPVKVYSGNLNSQDYCVNLCASSGYTYAGVEYGVECWCGNSITAGAGAPLPQSSCSMTCKGNSNQKCGESYVMNLFAKPATLTSLGCYKDTASRVFNVKSTSASNMTPLMCVNFCAAAGATYAGVEYGTQCWCGTMLSTKIADSTCSMKCGGSSDKCGGAYAMNVYVVGGGTTATTTTPPTTATSPVLVESKGPNLAKYGVTNGPSSGNSKFVYAHFMLGNSYGMTAGEWTQEINDAKSAGIDGFALNIGLLTDHEPGQLALAYNTALSLGNFKMFISLDMSGLPSCNTNDAASLANIIKPYLSHSVQAMYNGKPLLSTFGIGAEGGSCNGKYFGQGSPDKGWPYFKNLVGKDYYFIPASFQGVSTYKSAYWYNGVFEWNSAWSDTQSDLSPSREQGYLNSLRSDQGYMGAVSPWFYTHYNTKNFIWRSENWLLATRFEEVIARRNSYDMIELLTWNDWGESNYLGRIAIANRQPAGTTWTAGMPHTGLLSLIKLYSTAYKTGSFPAFSDKIWLWTRPHFAGSSASADSLGRPLNYAWTLDNLYVIVTLAQPARVKIQSGGNYATWDLPAGLTKLLVASDLGAVKASIVRGGATVKSYDSSGSFSYINNPKTYNFNYFVAEA